MNFHYDKLSDSLYIELSPKVSAESEEVAPGIVLDYDEAGQIVGLDIEHASRHTNLSQVHFTGFLPQVDLQPGAPS